MTEIEKQDVLARAMDQACEFPVGALVVPRAVLESQKIASEFVRARRYGDAPSAVVVIPDVVIQRYAQQCPGGIQRHYEVRRRTVEHGAAGAGTTDTVIRYLEHELASWEEAVQAYRAMQHAFDERAKGSRDG